MSRQIKAIVVYALLTGVLGVAVNMYIATSTMYKNKTAKIDANYQMLTNAIKAKTSGDNSKLVIGNSYVAASFHTEFAGSKFIKFSVSGMPLIDIVAVIENLPADVPFDTVLVGLGYNYANPSGGVSSAYQKYLSSNPVKRLWASLPMVQGRSLTSTIIKEDLDCLRSTRSISDCRKRAQTTTEPRPSAEKAQSTAEHEGKIRKNSLTRLREYEAFVGSVSTSLTDYIIRIKTACERRGIRVITYTAPIYYELRERLDPKVLEDFRKKVQQADVTYIDLNLVFPKWEAEYFSDATHLNKDKGGLVTTEYLVKLANQ